MSDFIDPHARMRHARTFIVERDVAKRTAHARTFQVPRLGTKAQPESKLQMSKNSRKHIETDVARFFDAICERRVCSFVALANEMDCNYSTVSRIRSESRRPSREWVEAFTANCHLTEAEQVTAYVLFGYIPPNHIVVPKVTEIPAFRTEEV